ncbi:CinA family protein [Thiohalorhabdus sp. Cl-TMA]|uniref:CinA family protein n=1 Tax=Thiohalorhabdus methylotrophus TaxID=3242694 RepID=A0ABV4TZF9_9GAMM
MDPDLRAPERHLGRRLQRKGKMIATAESCTGGGVAERLTAVPGSSAYVDRGWVTYTNAAKREQLGVGEDLLAAHGAVSDPVARAMATGALAGSRAQLAVSVTGIAGPSGGSPEKPVGTVWIGVAAGDGEAEARHQVLSGPRGAVRWRTVNAAIAFALDRVEA